MKGFLNERQENIVASAIENTIDVYSHRSAEINNVASNVKPVVVNRILVDSDKIFIVDTKGDVLKKYGNLFAEFQYKNDITVYGSKNAIEQLQLDPRSVEMKIMTDTEIDRFKKINIRSIVLGDNKSYIVESNSAKPSLEALKNEILSIFSSTKNNSLDESAVNFESKTVFRNKEAVQQLIEKVKNNIGIAFGAVL